MTGAEVETATPPALKPGLVLVDDLMFASQIQGLARSAGFQLLWARSAEKAIVQARAMKPACIVIDVNMVGAGIDELVANLISVAEPAPAIIGFGSHVDAASLHHAREAGCDIVLPRSKLVQDLATNLMAWVEKKQRKPLLDANQISHQE